MLTRFGYHSLVVVWLGVLCVVDIVGNTMLTGVMSDVYFYKVFLDGALIWWTFLYLREDVSGKVVSSGSSKAHAGRADEQVVVVDLGAAEYVYYGFLFIYGFANFYFHHTINKESVGLVSMATLIVSMADFVISAVAGYNFIQVARGKIVKLQQKMS